MSSQLDTQQNESNKLDQNESIANRQKTLYLVGGLGGFVIFGLICYYIGKRIGNRKAKELLAKISEAEKLVKLNNSELEAMKKESISDFNLKNDKIAKLELQNIESHKVNDGKIAELTAKLVIKSEAEKIDKIAILILKGNEIKASAEKQINPLLTEAEFLELNTFLDNSLAGIKKGFKEIIDLIEKENKSCKTIFDGFYKNFDELETLNKMSREDFIKFCSENCEEKKISSIADCLNKISCIETIVEGLDDFDKSVKEFYQK